MALTIDYEVIYMEENKTLLSDEFLVNPITHIEEHLRVYQEIKNGIEYLITVKVLDDNTEIEECRISKYDLKNKIRRRLGI